MPTSDGLKARVEGMVGSTIPLLGGGLGRITGTDATGVDMLVNGVRVRLTWGRVDASKGRLAANHTLSVDELGGDQDAVGLVSLLGSALEAEDVLVDARKGLLVVREGAGTPVHQYADMGDTIRRTGAAGL